MQQKSFENTLNEKVKDFELKPRTGMWQAIEAELEPEKKRIAPFWWGVSIAVAVSIALLLVVNNNPVSSTKKAAHSNPRIEDIANKQVVTDVLPMETNNSHVESSRKPHSSALIPIVTDNYFKGKGHLITPSALPTLASNLVKNNLHKVEVGKPIICGLTSSSTVITIDTTMLTLATPTNPKDSLPKDTPVVIDNGIRQKVPQILRHAFVGLILQPTQSNSMLTENPHYIISPSNFGSDFKYRQSTDRAIQLFNATALFGWQAKRHQYHTGIGFQRFGYQQNVKNIERIVSTGNPITTTNTRLYATDSFLSAAYAGEGQYVKNKFAYLTIPLGYQFQFIQKQRWQLALRAEASVGVLLQSKALFYDESTGYYVKQNARALNLTKKFDGFISTGIAVHYLLSDQWTLFVQPSIGMSLRPLQIGAVNTRYQFLKWGFGLQYNLN